MLAKVKIFVGFVLLSLCLQTNGVAQGNEPDLAWYQQFFRGKTQSRIKELIRKGTQDLDAAVLSHNAAAEAKALTELGLIYLAQEHDDEKALDFLIRSLAMEDSLGLRKQKIYTSLAIARVFEGVGDDYKSAQLLAQALEAAQSTNDAGKILVLNDLGRINAGMGRLDEAFENYQEALRDSHLSATPDVEANIYFNLGKLYTLQKKYQQALDSHKKALAIFRTIGDRPNEASSLNEIGELYLLMKNDKKVLANHVAALEIRQLLKDKRGIAESYNNIGKLYFHQKNVDKAVSNLLIGLQAGQESQAQDQISRSYEALSRCYEVKKDYKKALAYKDLFLAISEFISNEGNARQLVEIQNRYVIVKNEAKILQLESIRVQREKEIRAQKQERKLLITLLGFGIVIVLLVLYLYYQKRKGNRELQIANQKVVLQNAELLEVNATKDKFFSIIGHDLKGPLNSLTSFSGLLINHTDSLSKEEIKMLALDLDKSLKNLFALLENLLEWSRSQTGKIEFIAAPFDLAGVMKENEQLLLAQAKQKQIAINNTVSDNLLVNAHRNSMSTVLRNLISNSIKFTPPGGQVTLSARCEGSNAVISISDNGVGMSKEVIQKLFRIDTKHTTKGTADEKGTGLGLILSREFVEKNGGTIQVESEVGKGTTFTIQLAACAGPAPGADGQNAHSEL